MNPPQNPKHPPAQNGSQLKARRLLLAAAVALFSYPVTGLGPVWQIAYPFFFVALLSGIVALLPGKRLYRWGLGLCAAVLCISSLLEHFGVSEKALLYVGYFSVLPYLGLVCHSLMRFIFGNRHVDARIIAAAATVYLLLGSLFMPLYGLLELTSPGSILDTNATGGVITWHSLIYFSFTTLTTLGYGDVQPVSMAARSLATLQAVTGVLYTTIIVARLVGLYAAQENESG